MSRPGLVLAGLRAFIRIFSPMLRLRSCPRRTIEHLSRQSMSRCSPGPRLSFEHSPSPTHPVLISPACEHPCRQCFVTVLFALSYEHPHLPSTTSRFRPFLAVLRVPITDNARGGLFLATHSSPWTTSRSRSCSRRVLENPTLATLDMARSSPSIKHLDNASLRHRSSRPSSATSPPYPLRL
ncbi:hypothetical protein M426DRAFT_10374 [Hypoxylon sp. CI-4A]|nr:hypothetical protein M426DRAFT_10374 [Hypoxylon sp. CI-4A]